MSKKAGYDLDIFDQKDSYGRVVDDGRQTLSFAGAALDLVERTTSSALQKRAAVQALRENLGEWADEAVDKQGRWRRPLLTTKAFEEHISRKDGHLVPSGACQSSFGWAQLLYALDIRPGQSILSWKLPSAAFDPTKFGEIPLSIEGEAFCHIINLYRIYSKPRPKDFKTLDIARSVTRVAFCRFPFGTLSIDTQDGTCIGTFDSGASEQLRQARVPFSVRSAGIYEDCLSIGKEVTIAKYYNTIHHGASDTVMFLPAPSAPLQERVHSLLAAMPGAKAYQEPFLITQTWIEQASRIKRRVTTRGGSDRGIMEDVLAFLSTHSGDFRSQKRWRREAEKYLLQNFMVGGDTFRFAWPTTNVHSEEGVDGRIIRAVNEALLILLKKYTEASASYLDESPSGVVSSLLGLVNWQSQDAELAVEPWKTSVAALGADFERILRLRHTTEGRNFIVLELTPESPLWRADCQIKG